MSTPAPTSHLSYEKLYIANILARPAYIKVGSVLEEQIEDVSLRAIYHIVATKGEIYTRPGTLLATLDELPYDISRTIVEDVLSIVPDAEDVTLEAITHLKGVIEQQSGQRRLVKRLQAVIAAAGYSDVSTLASEVRAAASEFQSRHIGKDHTAKGIRARLKEATKHIRWRCGCKELDDAFQGIGPDGNPGAGLYAQGEVVVITAPYGVGKTRFVLNGVNELLDQGASVSYIALEDDDVSFATRLMGIRFDIEPWKLIQFGADEDIVWLVPTAKVDTEKCRAALEWFEGIGDRLRIYDGGAKANIFKFVEALALMENDAALYGLTHCVIDYATAWPGETVQLEENAFALRAFASRYNANVIELAQVSNDSIKWGSAPGQVAAKGSGAWGAAAHIGLELRIDFAIGQDEMAVEVKKARAAARRVVYAQINAETGRIKSYSGTPFLMTQPDPLPEGPGKQKRGKRG